MALNLQGATPSFGNPISPNMTKTNLGFLTLPNSPAPTVKNPLTGSGQSSTLPSMGNNPGLITPSAPKTPVASHTVTTPDGTTVKQTYTTDSTPPKDSSTNQLYDPATGFVTQYGQGQGAKPVQPNDPLNHTQNTQTSGSTQPPPLTVGGQAGNVTAAGQPNPIEQAGLNEGDLEQARERLANQIGLDVNTIKGIYSKPIPIEFQQGRAQVAQQAMAQKEAALEGIVSNVLTGRGQTLGAGQAIGTRQLGGAESVLGAVAPITGVTPGTQIVQPGLLGTSEGGVSGGISDADMQQYAQMAANGQISAVPSFITSNPVLNAQLNDAAKKINPNYNPITSAAQGSVLASIPALQAANTAASGIKNQIDTFLQTNPTINPNDLAVGNKIQQWISGKQLADPKYQNFFNMLNDYTNTLAPILGVGGSPTNLKTEIAQSFLNAQASGQSIQQVLDGLENLANTKIQNLQSGALGGGPVNPSSSGGSSTSDFGWNPQ